MTDNKNDINSNLCLSDGGSKKVMENIDVLLSDCFNSFDKDNPREWTELYSKYDEVISLFKYVNKLLQTRTIMTDNMINIFQEHADDFSSSGSNQQEWRVLQIIFTC